MSGNNLFEKLVRRIDDSLTGIADNFKYFIVLLLILILLLIILLGFAAGVLANLTQDLPQKQSAIGESNNTGLMSIHPLNTVPDERPHPLERIKENQIHVYNDKIVIDLKNSEWATFTDTNSMDPVIDAGSYALEVVPQKAEDIVLGDIISYNSDYASGTIIHRVVEIGNDSQGWYCRVKGDNNSEVDPGKIRFSKVQRVVVAIIY